MAAEYVQQFVFRFCSEGIPRRRAVEHTSDPAACIAEAMEVRDCAKRTYENLRCAYVAGRAPLAAVHYALVEYVDAIDRYHQTVLRSQ